MPDPRPLSEITAEAEARAVRAETALRKIERGMLHSDYDPAEVCEMQRRIARDYFVVSSASETETERGSTGEDLDASVSPPIPRSVSASEPCEHPSASFDRTLCACGSMHDYCEVCGVALDCPLGASGLSDSGETPDRGFAGLPYDQQPSVPAPGLPSTQKEKP